jgi:hypothetical protein
VVLMMCRLCVDLECCARAGAVRQSCCSGCAFPTAVSAWKAHPGGWQCSFLAWRLGNQMLKTACAAHLQRCAVNPGVCKCCQWWVISCMKVTTVM